MQCGELFFFDKDALTRAQKFVVSDEHHIFMHYYSATKHYGYLPANPRAKENSSTIELRDFFTPILQTEATRSFKQNYLLNKPQIFDAPVDTCITDSLNSVYSYVNRHYNVPLFLLCCNLTLEDYYNERRMTTLVNNIAQEKYKVLLAVQHPIRNLR